MVPHRPTCRPSVDRRLLLTGLSGSHRAVVLLIRRTAVRFHRARHEPRSEACRRREPTRGRAASQSSRWPPVSSAECELVGSTASRGADALHDGRFGRCRAGRRAPGTRIRRRQPCSRIPHGLPYSRSSCRNGTASKASGPRTPDPTRFRGRSAPWPPPGTPRSATPPPASCTPASTNCCRPRGTGTPRADCRPGPGPAPRCRHRSCRASCCPGSPGRAAARPARPAATPCTDPTWTCVVESMPSLCCSLSISMNSAPRPYLKVTRPASSHRGTSSTSSCSTFTHSTAPMPSGNSNTSGSLNGAVVNQPRPFS